MRKRTNKDQHPRNGARGNFRGLSTAAVQNGQNGKNCTAFVNWGAGWALQRCPPAMPTCRRLPGAWLEVPRLERGTSFISFRRLSRRSLVALVSMPCHRRRPAQLGCAMRCAGAMRLPATTARCYRHGSWRAPSLFALSCLMQPADVDRTLRLRTPVCVGWPHQLWHASAALPAPEDPRSNGRRKRLHPKIAALIFCMRLSSQQGFHLLLLGRALHAGEACVRRLRRAPAAERPLCRCGEAVGFVPPLAPPLACAPIRVAKTAWTKQGTSPVALRGVQGRECKRSPTLAPRLRCHLVLRSCGSAHESRRRENAAPQAPVQCQSTTPPLRLSLSASVLIRRAGDSARLQLNVRRLGQESHGQRRAAGRGAGARPAAPSDRWPSPAHHARPREGGAAIQRAQRRGGGGGGV